MILFARWVKGFTRLGWLCLSPVPAGRFGGRTLNVSLAEPRAQEQGAPAATAAAQIKAIYVGNLPEGATEEKLKELFSAHGEVSHWMTLLDHPASQEPCRSTATRACHSWLLRRLLILWIVSSVRRLIAYKMDTLV